MHKAKIGMLWQRGKDPSQKGAVSVTAKPRDMGCCPKVHLFSVVLATTIQAEAESALLGMISLNYVSYHIERNIGLCW